MESPQIPVTSKLTQLTKNIGFRPKNKVFSVCQYYIYQSAYNIVYTVLEYIYQYTHPVLNTYNIKHEAIIESEEILTSLHTPVAAVTEVKTYKLPKCSANPNDTRK